MLACFFICCCYNWEFLSCSNFFELLCFQSKAFSSKILLWCAPSLHLLGHVFIERHNINVGRRCWGFAVCCLPTTQIPQIICRQCTHWCLSDGIHRLQATGSENGATWVDLPSLTVAAGIHLKRERGFLVIESSSKDVVLPNESIESRPIKWTKMQCGCSWTTTLKLQSSLPLSTEVVMIFCECSRWSPKKGICRVCRQMIVPMTLSSAQHRSYTRLYIIARKRVSKWKKLQKKANTWNGICLNSNSVFVTVYMGFKFTIRTQISSRWGTLQNWICDNEDPESGLSHDNVNL